MSRVLTDKECQYLAEIGKKIILALHCNINGTGLPCRTDRLASVKLMREYLAIHDYELNENI
tara:strand:- start:4775 stop:4960 length:186 start_codon:yes stop_codon:yes gene_type:complete